MKVRLIAYGIARDILQRNVQEIEVPEHSTIEELKEQLICTYPAFQKLASLQFAIHEDYVQDRTVLQHNQEIIIIPPVSGG